MPIGVAPLAQRELDPLFDDMRTRAGVNALFTFIYTHEPHRAGSCVKVPARKIFTAAIMRARTCSFTRTRR